MRKDTETLSEIMLAAERFCWEVENRVKDSPPNADQKELRAKLGLCRTQLAYLQDLFEQDKLTIENPLVREAFRHLMIALLWVAFYCRNSIDFKLFRRLVLMEGSFSYLLASR